MKKVFAIVLSLIVLPCFAFAPVKTTNFSSLGCPQAVPTTDGGFCPSFKSVAHCQCVSRGLPDGMCQDMNALYSRMISMFGTLAAACEYQEKTSHDTTKQQCIDDWNCYRSGGRNSQGGLCSASGKAC